MNRHFNLILQSPKLSSMDLSPLMKMVKSQQIKELTPHAVKLLDVEPQAAIEEMCRQKKIDYAFMPADISLNHIRLVAIDMDSTLINIECIDEIANIAGLKEPVSAITERAMRGEIDFEQSLRARVALLAGIEASALQSVYEHRLQFNPGAEYLCKVLHDKNIYTILISGGFSYFTERLKNHLNLNEAVSNVLEISAEKLTGQLIGQIVDSQYKAHYVENLRIKLGLAKDQVVAIGDGANDIPMLQTAGYGIAFYGKPIVQKQARLSINHVGLEGVLSLFA